MRAALRKGGTEVTSPVRLAERLQYPARYRQGPGGRADHVPPGAISPKRTTHLTLLNK